MGTAFSDNENIISGVTIKPSIDDIATDINYYYRRNSIEERWSSFGTENDATQAAAFGKNYNANLELFWVRDDDTAVDVAERQLARRKTLRMEVSFDTPLVSLTNDLLSEITVDHYNGPTLSTLTINKMAINLDALIVSIVAKTEP